MQRLTDDLQKWASEHLTLTRCTFPESRSSNLMKAADGEAGYLGVFTVTRFTLAPLDLMLPFKPLTIKTSLPVKRKRIGAEIASQDENNARPALEEEEALGSATVDGRRGLGRRSFPKRAYFVTEPHVDVASSVVASIEETIRDDVGVAVNNWQREKKQLLTRMNPAL